MIYYPNGFNFPLVALNAQTGMVEIVREAATIVMLIGIGILAGKSKYLRWAFFLMAFAVWDLIYYLSLKLILDWPISFFTWDILFLIPVPWVGPVLSPIIVSITMIAFSVVLLAKEHQQQIQKLNRHELAHIIFGSLIIVTSWMWDYISYSGSIADSPNKALTIFSTYIPTQFNWWMFGVGEVLVVTGIILYWIRRKK